MPAKVDNLVLSKSLALVQKTKRRVAQIDTAAFPTDTSEHARRILEDALICLEDKKLWQPMNPEALYHALIGMQELVQQVEASTSDRISWPLVSYCDHFWSLIFPNGDVEIFYSVFSEHNFGIHSFTARVRCLLETVLPPANIDKIIGTRTIYCLQIASLEDENLPLYANNGHEFGHALYWAREQEILNILGVECDTVFRAIISDLVAHDQAPANRRVRRCACIIIAVATELFCDLVGAVIAGPAFLLSLYEMCWGADLNVWTVRLSPRDTDIRAYPSFAFRLNCVKGSPHGTPFYQNLKHSLDSLPVEKAKLKVIPGYIDDVPDDHSTDVIAVRPPTDSDKAAIESVLTKMLPDLKAALTRFVHETKKTVLSSLLQQPDFSPVSGEDVFQLIRRLDADILPNIIPNQTLLGMPASFATILNASALFRIHALSTPIAELQSEGVNRQVQKIERLTAKALEVSYVQREFANWETRHP